MNNPGIFPNSAKRYFLGLIFLFSHLYAYSQACNCPPINTCGACSGDYSEFTFRYNGFTAIRVDATDDTGILYTNIWVPTGTIFTFDGDPGNGKFKGQVKLWVNTFEHVTFVADCSFGLIVGNDYGSFTLLAAKSKNGGPLCCQPASLDTTDPIISSCPGNISVFANATCSTPVSWTPPTATDNCGAVTLSSTHAPGSNFPKGVTPVQYTATDDFGNTSTCSFNVTVVDNTNPVIAGCPSNITVNANASCQATVNWTAPTASDNCGTVTLTTTKSPGTVFSLGTTTVIYTATDAAGRTSTCSFNVVVQDNTNPVISGCPSNIVVNANATCQATVNWTVPTVSDNCPGATLTSTNSPLSVFPIGTTVVTYTARDAANNTSTCSFNVTVVDNTNPVITGCPSDITINANAACAATVNWTVPTVSDNCPGATLTSTNSPLSVFPIGTTVVTYTARDAANNTSTCSFNVIVVDNTNPVITGCPSNITINANAACAATVNWTVPTVSDNCPGATLTSTNSPLSVFPIGTTVVTYTARDAANNTSTCSFNVIVVDNTNPVITGCPSNITINANAACAATVNWTAPTVSDNCPGATLTSTNSPLSVFPIGTTVVTYTARDAANNTSTCSFNVTVVDNTNPVITGCPSNITINANAACAATVNWTAPTVSDNCPGATLTSTNSPLSVFPIGTTVVTYTARDAANNTSTCSFNVTVVDNTNPVITGCPSNITVNANGSCQATVNWTAPTVSDNCGGTLTLTTTKNPGTIFNLGTTIVTYTATDAAGNTATCSFNVTVQDNTNPVITGCPSNITVNADASCQATVNWIAPTVSDNCGGTLTLTTTKNPGTIFNLGTTVVTYTATDAAGNTSTCSFNVIVQDNTNPVIAGCPSNITVNADALCQATVNWIAPTVSDNCTGTLTLTSTKNPGTIFTFGTTIVTYTATDAAGNTSTCSFNVIVQDNTNPVIAGCPSNITVSANGSCQATVNWTAPTVSDNCGGTPTLTSTMSPGSVFNLGTTVVTYTATDAAGNTATCSFNVIVQDNTNPVIAGCPSNITVNTNALCQATVNWIAPTVSDNCGGTLTLTSTKNPGTLFNIGTTPVTYTATDAAGNTSTCSFNVIVQDNTNPVIAGCPSNITVNADASCQATVNWIAPTVSDNCTGTLTLTSTKNPGTLFNIGTTPVTYTATDAAGNTSTCSFNVIVQDNTNPVIAGCPSNITVNANASCQATVNWIAPTVSDNCGGTLTLTSTKNPGTLFNIGTTPVTYTATDAAGNTSTCSFNVIVQDNTNPVIAGCPSNITVNANGSCQATVNWTAPTVSDNCGGTPTLTSTMSPGSVFNLGTTVVTYTATDAAGNTGTCSFNVTVQDNTNPVITGCPSNITVNADASCQATVSWIAPTVSDNCGGAPTLTTTTNPGTTFSLGTTIVTYTATDAAGNTSTCSFNVIVQDNTDPVIAGCPSNITVNANALCQATVNWVAPTVSDNCAGTLTLTTTKSPGTVFGLGTTVVTYTATDAAGNTSTCSFNVIVQDNTNPVIAGCPSNITVNANASCQATVNWIAPTVSDNCGGTLTLTSTKNPGTLFNIGTTPVTYTATDAAGNTSTCSFNVIVQDNTNPVIAGCPSNITVNANASCQATVTWIAPTVSDNCGGTLTLTSTKNPGTLFNIGTTPVTYTATDAAGNTSTCSFNVIVQDNTNPVIAGCPSNITVNANASCQATVTWIAPTVSDNCGGTLTLTTTKNPGTIFSLGTTIVTYTATDAAGNTSTCSFNVIVQDNSGPAITGCPSNITASANASCQATVSWTVPTISDNCGGILTLTSTKNPGTLFNIGTTPVIYTATDAAGNTSTCSFNVIVLDNTNPVIAGCPSNITVNANASCQTTVNWIAPTVSDNCAGTLTLTTTKSPGTVFGLGTTVVTYTATDAAGNTSTCSFNVTVQDNTNPVIAGCPSDVTVNANASCLATVNWAIPTVSDNCVGTITLTSTKNPGTLFSVGTTPVTYTATDAAGNSSTCSFNVIVQDNTGPVIAGCPADVTVDADASCQATVNWTVPTVSDNCGGTVTLASTKNPGTVFGVGTTVVIYTATDAVGNTSTCSFNVIVQDNTNPVIAGCPSNITVNANASCQATVSWTAPTASDNCAGTSTLTTTKSPGTAFGLGTTVVTYTATDAAGNTSTCSFDVTVQDNTNPVIAGCPSNITVNANASCQATVNWAPPTASGNCGGTLTLTSTKNPGTLFSVGTTPVTYTATDAAGNTSTCSFNVTVLDNTGPAITGCPANITVSANASCQATVSWTVPTASDCGDSVTLTTTNNPGSVFSLGSTLVTYTATDITGNTSTCSFTVVVQDDMPPQFSACTDIRVSAGGSCNASATWVAPVASDCGPITVTSSHNSGDVFPLGTTQVTYTAIDGDGHTSTCSFNVTVEDKTPPLFASCPSNIIVKAKNSCEALVSWTEPTAIDNCLGVTVTKSHSPGGVFPAGTTVVKYTATDTQGNQTVCQFNVTVKVEDLPVFSKCPANIHAKSDESGDAAVEWTVPTATPVCGPVTLTSSHQPGDDFPIGTTTVEYKAEDSFGNVSYCRFQVEVTAEEIEIDISQIVTPDGNTQNDEWIVANIEKFTDNKVVIVDRWGGVIYTASGYNNETVVWKGYNRNGDLVPTGTYFYTISVRYGPSVFEKTGFIELIR